MPNPNTSSGWGMANIWLRNALLCSSETSAWCRMHEALETACLNNRWPAAVWIPLCPWMYQAPPILPHSHFSIVSQVEEKLLQPKKHFSIDHCYKTAGTVKLKQNPFDSCTWSVPCPAFTNGLKSSHVVSLTLYCEENPNGLPDGNLGLRALKACIQVLNSSAYS